MFHCCQHFIKNAATIRTSFGAVLVSVEYNQRKDIDELLPSSCPVCDQRVRENRAENERLSNFRTMSKDAVLTAKAGASFSNCFEAEAYAETEL